MHRRARSTRFHGWLGQLSALHDRVEDLLPIVRDHVYHPDFLGSFSIKDVLPALVPDMSYDDLDIQDGEVASAVLEAMLLGGDRIPPSEKRLLRRNPFKYGERDTLAMVRVHSTTPGAGRERACDLSRVSVEEALA